MNSIVGIVVFLVLLMFIYVTYNFPWSKSWVMWICIASLAFVGVFGLILHGIESPNYFLFIGLALPLFVYSFMQLLRYISNKKHGRDFIFDTRFNFKPYRSGIDGPSRKTLSGYKQLPELNSFDLLATYLVLFIPLFSFMFLLALKN